MYALEKIGLPMSRSSMPSNLRHQQSLVWGVEELSTSRLRLADTFNLNHVLVRRSVSEIRGTSIVSVGIFFLVPWKLFTDEIDLA